MQGVRVLNAQSLTVNQNGKMIKGEQTNAEKPQNSGFGDLLNKLKSQLQQLDLGNQHDNAEVTASNSILKVQSEQAVEQGKIVQALESELKVQEDDMQTSEIKLDVQKPELRVVDNDLEEQVSELQMSENEQEEQLSEQLVLEIEQKEKMAEPKILVNETQSKQLEGNVVQNLPQEIRNVIDFSIKKVTNFPTEFRDNPITLPISDLLEENPTAKVLPMQEEQTTVPRNMEKVLDLNKGFSIQQMMMQQSNVQSETTNKPIEQVRTSHFVEDIKGILKQQFTHFQNKEMSQVRVMLNPEHLGHLDILISEKQGKLHAQLLTATHAAKETLDMQIHVLKATLINQGINVDKIEVSQQTTQTQDMMQNQSDSRQQKQQSTENHQGHQKNRQKSGYDNEEPFTTIDSSNYEQREYVTQVNYVV